MNRPKVARICLRGGIAAALIGVLLFGAGVAVTVTAPYYPDGEPRGAAASWAGVVAVVVGLCMIIVGAIIKALGAGKPKGNQRPQT